MYKKIILSAAALLASVSLWVSAQEDGRDSAQPASKTEVVVDGTSIYINAPGDVFEINGPNAFSFSSDQPYFDFGGEIPDGSYAFKVYQSAGVKGAAASKSKNLQNGRSASARPGNILKVVSAGNFKIKNNTISTEK